MRNLEIHVFIWQIHPDRNSRFFHIYVTRNKITGTYNNNKKFIKETECPNRELNLIFQFKYLNQKHSCYNIHNRYNLRIICNLKYNETISRYKNTKNRGILKKKVYQQELKLRKPRKLNSEYQETQTFTKRRKINSNHSNQLNQRSSNLSLINYHPAPNTCLTTYPSDTHNFPFPTRRTFLTLNPPNVLDPT